MKQLLSIVIIILGICLGITGFTKLENNESSIEIGDLKLSAEDKEDTNTAYVLMGLGITCILGGSLSLNKK